MKVILTGLLAAFALVAGLVIAAMVAIGGAFFVGLSRLLGRSSGVRVRTQVHGRPVTRPAPAQRNSDDIIDVTATEVTADPSLR